MLPLRLSPSRPRMTTYRFEPPATTRWMTYPSPSPLASTTTRRCRNINLLTIAYAYRPRLRIRLTLGGLTWPRKPGVYGERVSHPFYRYSCLHKLFQKLHASFRSRFSAVGILSYHSVESAASVPYLAPLHFRRRFTRPVSYYAFFKGWLLLSQPPGCLCSPTSFST